MYSNPRFCLLPLLLSNHLQILATLTSVLFGRKGRKKLSLMAQTKLRASQLSAITSLVSRLSPKELLYYTLALGSRIPSIFLTIFLKCMIILRSKGKNVSKIGLRFIIEVQFSDWQNFLITWSSIYFRPCSGGNLQLAWNCASIGGRMSALSLYWHNTGWVLVFGRNVTRLGVVCTKNRTTPVPKIYTVNSSMPVPARYWH